MQWLIGNVVLSSKMTTGIEQYSGSLGKDFPACGLIGPSSDYEKPPIWLSFGAMVKYLLLWV